MHAISWKLFSNKCDTKFLLNVDFSEFEYIIHIRAEVSIGSQISCSSIKSLYRVIVFNMFCWYSEWVHLISIKFLLSKFQFRYTEIVTILIKKTFLTKKTLIWYIDLEIFESLPKGFQKYYLGNFNVVCNSKFP